jgi:nucleoside 2-deoxyribosyltransferase
MKIYFAGAIRGGREDQELYLKIINYLKQYGEVLTEHVGAESINILGEKDNKDNFIYERDMEWLIKADVIVAEVTTPSLGVGYEIGRAIQFNKKVICLYRDNQNKRLSAMLSGNKKLKIIFYEDVEGLKEKIRKYL